MLGRIVGGDGQLVEIIRDGVPMRDYADVPPTIVHNLVRGAQRWPDRPLLVSEAGVTTTYRDFAELVEGAAARLCAEGLRPGDALAVAARNGLDVAVAIWACARAGVLFVGLPVTLKPPQWAYLLAHSRARLALGEPEFLDPLRAAAVGARIPPDRVREVGDHLVGQRLAWREHTRLPAPDDLYGVVYTSGTTGRPKASQLVHRSTMNVARFYQRLLGLTPDDRTAIHLPFYYVSGHVSQLNPMMLAGGSAVPMPSFSPSELVDVLIEHGVSVLDVVPSIFGLLLRDGRFRSPDLAHVRAAIFGGAPMPAATIDELRERMPQMRLFDIYGMSETGGIISCLHDVELGRKPGSVGRPVPCAEVLLTDADGVAVPTGAVGELRVRGPMVTTGYLHDPAGTAEALENGWLRTGDLARADEDGYLYVVGRAKEMISRGGVKLYPAELEAVLREHPTVAEAAVFGVPDEVAGELVAAYVVAAAGAVVRPTELRGWVRERMASHAVPRHLRVVDELPRNPTGKLDKPALQERLLAELDEG
ncbi:MAG: acyl--CoA ligase [Pseudonocardiales bacterium]|nr:acyl--CoA ligase [Pseudonocardiales bacterium]